MNPVPMLYLKDDLNKAVEMFVIGHCFQWNEQMKQFKAGDQEFFLFALRTSNKVLRYVLGEERTLDGTFSDHEVHVASQADRIFRVHLIHILKRDISQLDFYDNGAEVERLQARLNLLEGRP